VENIDVEGHFWPVGHPENQVAGRLRFDERRGVELDLIGSFHSFEEMFAEESAKEHRILGLIDGGKYVTLERCFQTNSRLEGFSDVRRQSFSAQHLLHGAHFEPDEPAEFTSITVDTDYLSHWVQRSEIRTEIDPSVPGSRSIRLDLSVPEKESFDLNLGTLSLGFHWKTEGDRRASMKLSHGCIFTREFDSVTPLRDVLRFGRAIQDLVTIGTDVPVLQSSVELKHPDIAHTFEDGTRTYLPIRFFAQPSAKIERSPKPPDARRMIFSYDQIGGIKGVAEWLSVRDRYRQVLGTLLSFRYSPMYMENKFQNCLQAAETFHRIRFSNELEPKADFKSRKRKVVSYIPLRTQREWVKKSLEYANEPRLRQRLEEMVAFADPPFSSLVGDPAAWAKRVTDQRNTLVHLDPRRSGADVEGGTLYFLAESAYFLVVLCLLRECGVPDDTIRQIEKNERFQFIAEHVKDELSKPAVRRNS